MSGLLKYIGLDRLGTLGRLIKQHGGIRGAYMAFYRTDDLKEGQLIGEDKYGNKYYQNNKYFYGRNRWVSLVPSFYFSPIETMFLSYVYFLSQVW